MIVKYLSKQACNCKRYLFRSCCILCITVHLTAHFTIPCTRPSYTPLCSPQCPVLSCISSCRPCSRRASTGCWTCVPLPGDPSLPTYISWHLRDNTRWSSWFTLPYLQPRCRLSKCWFSCAVRISGLKMGQQKYKQKRGKTCKANSINKPTLTFWGYRFWGKNM